MRILEVGCGEGGEVYWVGAVREEIEVWRKD